MVILNLDVKVEVKSFRLEFVNNYRIARYGIVANNYEMARYLYKHIHDIYKQVNTIFRNK